ncbi:hypothetical protein SAMN02745702_00751 [Desulfobaculum bizertense DSM 18034]|uniref:Uncharacterized protein n=1 Tax=Desulfobaculum bizertense DSM 18034 TaxID=1121442 RepID=A0A1T4VQA9_9BACT|nr:hypothetical protein SAMN02745702_00751 [Desulfobaculum bizertense DSM 18034]
MNVCAEDSTHSIKVTLEQLACFRLSVKVIREDWGPAPKPPRKGMIPLRILIEFKSRASFACTAFKLNGAA